MAANKDELRGMRLVVLYLLKQSERLRQVASRYDPDSERAQTAHIKAATLIEAAAKIEAGIEEEEKKS